MLKTENGGLASYEGLQLEGMLGGRGEANQCNQLKAYVTKLGLGLLIYFFFFFQSHLRNLGSIDYIATANVRLMLGP